MTVNNISYTNKTPQMYNFANEKPEKQKSQISFQNKLIDAQKSLDIRNLYNNYNKNDFVLQTRAIMPESTSILERFTQVDSEYPNSIQYDTYLDKPDGTGTMVLHVQIENCGKDTKINEEELKSALEKIVSIANKVESLYYQMGYRLDDESHVCVKYSESTGKIDTKEAAKGANELVKMAADIVYKDCLKDENISKEELMKIKANLEKIKKEMDDFIMKFTDDEVPNGKIYTESGKQTKYPVDCEDNLMKTSETKTT